MDPVNLVVVSLFTRGVLGPAFPGFNVLNVGRVYNTKATREAAASLLGVLAYFNAAKVRQAAPTETPRPKCSLHSRAGCVVLRFEPAGEHRAEHRHCTHS